MQPVEVRCSIVFNGCSPANCEIHIRTVTFFLDKLLQFNWFVSGNGGHCQKFLEHFFWGPHPELTYLEIMSCDFAFLRVKRCATFVLQRTRLFCYDSWFSLLHPGNNGDCLDTCERMQPCYHKLPKWLLERVENASLNLIAKFLKRKQQNS